MQKSIFKRYLYITMLIIVLSFTLLGSVMMFFFGQYWRHEKKELLTQNSNSVAAMASNFISQEHDGYNTMRSDMLKPFISTLSQNIDADLFITDTEGNIVLGNFYNSKITAPERVPEKAVSAAVSGFYEGQSSFDGMFPGSFYTVGVPITDPNTSDCAGAVFAATSVSSINAYQQESFMIFFFAAIAALAFTFVVVGAFSYRFAKPLRQMSIAAMALGSGNFSVRVPVSGDGELAQLAMSFNSMANSLSASEGTHRSFVANVSHELKTPMTTIAGFIDGILDGTIPQDQQKKYLQIVSDEVKRLSRLVRSMLDLSRIDSGEMKLTRSDFDLGKVVFDTLIIFEKAIDSKELEIRGMEELGSRAVNGDQDLIHQVIYNLIENAVKFTNPGGYIHIRMSDSIDRTVVSIENSGAGIDPEDLPLIFEKFYKTDKSRSKDKNGMGLGLYIVKTIIKLHGGNIRVSSEQDKATVFEFYIPKASEAPRRKEPIRIKENIHGKEDRTEK